MDLNEAILVRNLRNPHVWKFTGNSPEFSPEFSPLFFRRFSHVLYWPRPSVSSQRFVFTSSWHFVRAFRLGASSWRFVLAFRPSLVPALRPSVSSQPCSRASSHRFVLASSQRLPRAFGHALGVGRGDADALGRAMVRRRMSDPLNKAF